MKFPCLGRALYESPHQVAQDVRQRPVGEGDHAALDQEDAVAAVFDQHLVERARLLKCLFGGWSWSYKKSYSSCTPSYSLLLKQLQWV